MDSRPGPNDLNSTDTDDNATVSLGTLERVRETLRWWDTLTPNQREFYGRRAVKLLIGFDTIHEGSDEHLLGTCGCLDNTGNDC